MRRMVVVLLVVLMLPLAAACYANLPPPARQSSPSSPVAGEPRVFATLSVTVSPAPTATVPAPIDTIPPPTATSPAESAATPEVGKAASLWETLDPARFSRSTTVNNPWLPLTPGTRLTYEGTTIGDDDTPVSHRVVVNVTDLTKMIGGIRSVVTWDLDYSDEELVEAELAFYAQDDDGRVWRMGEYPEAYEEGKFVEAPAWIHAFEDARAGIMMLADPKVGTPSYAQGWAPAVDWTDRGRVDQVGQQTCVPAGCYEDVLVIAETSQSEPNAEQLKYYARGVGNVRVGWRGAEEKTKESLELVEVEELSEQELADIRAQALQLEQHAYVVSKDVYGQTSPLEPAPKTTTE